jgi:hypothetical protein
MDQGETGLGCELLAQQIHQTGVDLDGYDAARPGYQALGERALAGADFDDQRFTLGTRGARDAFEDGG